METEQTIKNPVTVYVESTPNPVSLKFVASRVLNPAPSILYTDMVSAKSSPLASELFKFPFVKSIFIAANFITITRIDGIEWNEVMSSLRDFLRDYLEKDLPVFNKVAPPVIHVDGRPNIASQEIPKPFTEMETRIAAILDEYIKPAVEGDGGAISLKSFDNGVATVVMQGACSGCPSSTFTLKAGIEGLLKRMVPESKIGGSRASLNAMENIKEQLKNPIVRFVIKAAFIYGLWEILNWLWMHNNAVKVVWLWMHGIIRTNIIDVSVLLLKLFGYQIEQFGIVIRVVGSPGVAVGPACVGFGLLFAFTGLIIAYHGKPKDKLWFIPIGLLGIHLINIIRIVSLAIVSSINNNWVEFNHKYVFNTIVYIFIFIMWINWVKLVERREI